MDERYNAKLTDLGIAYWGLGEGKLEEQVLKKPDMKFYVGSEIFERLLKGVKNEKRIDFM